MCRSKGCCGRPASRHSGAAIRNKTLRQTSSGHRARNSRWAFPLLKQTHHALQGCCKPPAVEPHPDCHENGDIVLLPHRPFRCQPNQTVPTGLSRLPPPGPAIPLIDSATFAWLLAMAPITIAVTTSSLTAPCVFKHKRIGHPASPVWPDCCM